MPQLEVRNANNEVIAGLRVNGIASAAGTLPIITDVFLPAPVASVTESGKTDYSLAILTEDLIEYHYLTAAEPRLFILGLEGSLATQYVGVMFGAPVAKGRATINDPEGTPVVYAHSIGTITR
jgi:hypothetical protein